jgi:hypothetical protein
MLLRRLTQHFKEQNWFAVGLDFLIVVSGIYIGLQVDAWRVSQNERVMEGQYLERLLVDMEASVAVQLQDYELEKAGIVAMDKFASALARGELSEEGKAFAMDAMNFIGWVERPATNLITVRELQSSGNISLIRDVEVRNAIGKLEFSLASANYSAEQTSAILRASQPEIVKWAYLPPSDTGQWGYDVILDYDYILSVPHASKIISVYSGWFKYHSSLLQNHHSDTVALRDVIKKALAEPH